MSWVCLESCRHGRSWMVLRWFFWLGPELNRLMAPNWWSSWMAQSWNLGTKQPPVVNPQPRAGRDGKRGAVLGRIRASWCDGVAKLRLSDRWCDGANAFLEWTDAPKPRKQGSCVRRSATPAVRQGAGAGSCGCQNLIAGPHQPPPAGEDGFPIDLSAFVSKPDPVWILISETL